MNSDLATMKVKFHVLYALIFLIIGSESALAQSHNWFGANIGGEFSRTATLYSPGIHVGVENRHNFALVDGSAQISREIPVNRLLNNALVNNSLAKTSKSRNHKQPIFGKYRQLG